MPNYTQIGIPQTRQSLLVRMKNADDSQAWAEFEAIYRPAVFRFARRRSVQPADAEDLAQQVMLAVTKQIPEWRADSKAGSFRAWLLTVNQYQDKHNSLAMLRDARA